MYILHIYIYYIYIYTTFIYTLHLYIYYTIISVGKCRDELESPKKIPTRPYSLQGRDTPLWYTPKIGSGQNLLSRLDSTDSLINYEFEISSTKSKDILRQETIRRNRSKDEKKSVFVKKKSTNHEKEQQIESC
jgi:hypothetical protein